MKININTALALIFSGVTIETTTADDHYSDDETSVGVVTTDMYDMTLKYWLGINSYEEFSPLYLYFETSLLSI